MFDNIWLMLCMILLLMGRLDFYKVVDICDLDYFNVVFYVDLYNDGVIIV